VIRRARSGLPQRQGYRRAGRGVEADAYRDLARPVLAARGGREQRHHPVFWPETSGAGRLPGAQCIGFTAGAESSGRSLMHGKPTGSSTMAARFISGCGPIYRHAISQPDYQKGNAATGIRGQPVGRIKKRLWASAIASGARRRTVPSGEFSDRTRRAAAGQFPEQVTIGYKGVYESS